jgi:hypothetical protein
MLSQQTTAASTLQEFLQCLWIGDWGLANETAAHVGCGMAVHQSSILQERDSGNAANTVGCIAAVRRS